MSSQRSIVIGGGAFAGLGLALALRQGLGPEIAIVVADPAFATRPSRDPRASAIVAACRRLFEAIGVWDQVAADAQPILDMVITDSRLEDATRPVFLTFAGEVEPGEPFAHMVENRRLIDALTAREKLGSTGLGQGIAIPHGRIKGLKDARGAFVRLAQPIAFDAPDGRPVNQVFVLLVPEQATERHLELLSELAQMFSERAFRERLAAAADAHAAWTAIREWATPA